MQICAEVRRANERIKHPEQVKLLDFDLSPDQGGDAQGRDESSDKSRGASRPQVRHTGPQQVPILSQEERERKAALSRARWGGIMGAYQQGAKTVASTSSRPSLPVPIVDPNKKDIVSDG